MHCVVKRTFCFFPKSYLYIQGYLPCPETIRNARDTEYLRIICRCLTCVVEGRIVWLFERCDVSTSICLVVDVTTTVAATPPTAVATDDVLDLAAGGVHEETAEHAVDDERLLAPAVVRDAIRLVQVEASF